MPRRVTVKYASLKSSLVNLPISMYGPLVEHRVRPQSLAVHLISTASQPPKSAYVGWTGMASSSSLAQFQNGIRAGDALETVEIDPQVASSLGFTEGSTLEIGLLHDLEVATSVNTEPVSPDDWEILELHAGYVEDNLLSQVRAASVGQEVDVWVLGRTRVRFRVVSYNPPGPAVLLSTNTEVSIAPRLRSQSSSSLTDASSWHQIDPAISTSKSVSFGNKVVLRAFPYDLLPQSSSVVIPESESCVWVSPRTFVQLTGETHLRETSLSGSHQHYASIRKLRPHVSPLSVTNGWGSADWKPPPPRTRKRTMHKTWSSWDLPEEEKKLQEAVLLRSSEDIPDHHFLCLDMEGIEDWDLVWFALYNLSSQPTQVLAGVEHLIQECRNTVLNVFTLQALQHGSVTIPGLLLYGRSGSGRTSIVKEVMKRLREDGKIFAHTLYVDLTKHGEERILVLKSLFQFWLDVAKWHRPSVIVFDNLERVVPAEVEHADSFRSRHLAEHFLSVFGAKTVMAGIMFIATCQSQAALHPLLLSTHMFSTVVPLKPPNKDARRDILAGIVESKLSSSGLRVEAEHPLNYVSLATQTEGYLATDLHDLVSRAAHQATSRAAKAQSVVRTNEPWPPLTTLLRQADFESAQVDFTPLSLRDVKLQHSDILWSDIGGLHETRRVLRETLEWPTKYGAIFASCPLRLRSGLLLYGFPGCGKTLLASAVAKECGLNFISVKGPELLNKYIGASEKSVRDLFDRASAAKPCILFFDEFDSIAPKRGHDSTGVTDRVVNQLLTQMDGAEGLDGVYVLAATSRPDLIDAALLRPGRLDKSLLCDMPDKHERLEIMEAISKKVVMAPDVDLNQYAEATEGFSGADLQALIYNAHLEVVHSTLENSPHPESDDKQLHQDSDLQYTSFGGPTTQRVMSRAEQDVLRRRLSTILASQITPTSVAKAKTAVLSKAWDFKALFGYPHDVQDTHLQNALRSARPSVPPEERERLSRIYRAFVAERSGRLPVPPEAGGIGNRVSLM
ncbi:P-loop containing nucleoside triphosphate hydrolase protein [Gautieria morchelliformis]|nr:P-loop containing nucleoside triphosphate hydrolase protein [Gautieria morchelliformis]